MIKKIAAFVIVALAASYAASCDLLDFEAPPDSNLPSSKEMSIDNSAPVSEVDFSGVSGSVSVRINNLENKSVYLVKYAAARVPAGQTGYAVFNEYSAQPLAAAVSPERSAASGVFTAGDGSVGVRYDHLAAQRFNGNPPPAFSGGASRVAAENAQAIRKVYTEDGSTGRFWVEADSSGKWIQTPAVLRAESKYAAVWVADENFTQSASDDSADNKITREQAESLASRFDVIYQKETPIFGHEYGGGDGGDGGLDGDLKIQIFVYDIAGDYGREQTSGVFGYFWAKDFYTQADIDRMYNFEAKTNAAEIFYLDAHFADKYPDGAISTLAHEFQHMINFNEKAVKSSFKLSSETWFDEMLSMLAEDIIDPLSGVAESEFPYNQRMPLFLNVYSECAPTTWLGGESALNSYANSYAFGAYLTRNFGGARLIQEMMANGKVNEESVAAAVNAVLPTADQGGDWDFVEILSRYGEALIFSGKEKPSSVFSFDNTTIDTINGTEYTFTGFDIWRMDNPLAGQKLSFKYNMFYPSQGPLVIDAGYIVDMPKDTFVVQSNAAWKNKTGSLTLTLRKPASSAVAVFIMIK
ncbi:MAG: hypothetical protein LBG43_01430 [Treponema sp.]|jgi:hypothetical protein|nr:hypothetical protein [Treponema sp.]